MIEMEVMGEEGTLLSLGLAIVFDSASCDRIKNKIMRKRSREVLKANEMSGVMGEGKMLRLFETREKMLKREKKRGELIVGGLEEDGDGLHLIHLLLVAATSLDEGRIDITVENLKELYGSVSLTGDSVQRVTAYFADGLVARFLTRKSPFHEMIMKEPTPEEEFLAFMELYKVSPYFQFAHFTANQAIMEAFEKEEETNDRALHVIDLDVSYGFQWPSLMQSLSEKANAGNRVYFRITTFGRSLEELQETEARLVSFAKGFRNLVFEFHGLLMGSRLDKALKKRRNETVAVNLVFHLSNLCNFTHISETLKSIHRLNPSVVVLVEQEGSRAPRSFLSRFMEFLHYFAAMFDSLDDFLPLNSSERLVIEKNHLGKEIKRLMNADRDEANSPKFERNETWKARMESHGFAEIPLSSKSIIQAKLLLKIRSHYCPNHQFGGENGGFTAFERDDGASISLAWQDKCLITASAWECA